MYPAALLAIPLATAALIYLYRKRGISRDTVVSTLLLLQKLPERLSARRRFIPPLQFWIDLLIVFLLICAVSDLRATGTGKRIAILIDTSLSMSAREEQGASRLEYAKKLAIADLVTFTQVARFTLFTAGDGLRVNSEADSSPQQIALLIPDLTATYTQDALPAQIKNLFDSKEFDSVWVYTDHTLEDVPTLAPLKLVSVIERGTTPPNNIWLSSLKPYEQNSLWEFTATVASSTTQAAITNPISGVITFQCYTSDGTFIPTPHPLTQAFTLPPHTSQQLTMKDIPSSWEACSASLTSLPLSANAIEMDDTLWITKASALQRIRVFSPLSVNELKLSSLPNFTFEQSNTSDLTRSARNESPTAFDIYHRTAPSVFPSENFAVIAPPPGQFPPGATISSRSDVSSPQQISRWDAAHPLMRYVQPHLLSFPIDTVIDCPQSSTPIISAPLGNLLCAGEEDGRRYVITAFELFPFEGKQNPALSIITLNIFKWLSQSRGENDIPPGVSSAKYILPRVTNIPVNNLETHSFKEPGVIRFSKGSSQFFLGARNFIIPEESDLSRQSLLSLALSPAPREKYNNSSQTLSWWLAVITLAMLCADGIRRFVLTQRWRGM